MFVPRITTWIFIAAFLFSSSVSLFGQSKETPQPPAEKGKKETENVKQPAPEEKAKPKETSDTPSSKDSPAKPTTPEKKPDSSKPKTHKVGFKKMVVTAELSGLIEAAQMTPILVNPKAWADLVVKQATPHGVAVKKGDVILQLETEKLEKAIQDQKHALPLEELTLKETVQSLELAEKTTPLDLESARRSKMEAEEALAYYEDVTKPMRIRSTKEDLNSSKESLAYAEEELKQLKKMYENDDVTEETEEIILRRAQNSVDRYRWYLEQTTARVQRTLNTTIPREHQSMKRSLDRKQISWRAGEVTMREALEKKRLETEQARRKFKKSQEKLADYEKDLKAMTVRAPHDGIVYYGMAQRGKWTTASTVERKLVPGGKLTAKEIVMTVTVPETVQLRVAVPEDKLKDLAEGQKGVASLKWNKDIELDAVVDSFSYVPLANNTFDVAIQLKKKNPKSPVFPGMNATAKIKVYESEKTLTVPKSAVKKEDDKSFVTRKGGKKQEVKTGHSDKDSIEILEGLKEGDEIEFTDKPSTTKTSSSSSSSSDKKTTGSDKKTEVKK